MILILILLLIIIFLIVYLRKESFQDLTRTELENIEKSVVHFKKELNLSDTEIDVNGTLLNEYLNVLSSNSADVNELSDGELPIIDNNNYTKYNHKLQLVSIY